MTKKELLENAVFKSIPMDTELVFDINIDDPLLYPPLIFEQLTYEYSPIVWIEKPIRDSTFEPPIPKFKHFLKIKAFPVY